MPIDPLQSSRLITLALQENVLEDVAQSQDTSQVAVLVDDYEAVDAGLSDGVEDGVETVLECAGVNAWEVLVMLLVTAWVYAFGRVTNLRTL